MGGFYLDDQYYAFPGDFTKVSEGWAVTARRSEGADFGMPANMKGDLQHSVVIDFRTGAADGKAWFSQFGSANGYSSRCTYDNTPACWVKMRRSQHNAAFMTPNVNPNWVIKGNKLYDPTLDSTRTMLKDGFVGNGPQRENDNTTWTWRCLLYTSPSPRD